MYTNAVIDGVISALSNRFGNEYKYYPENIEQDMKVPCFLIRCIRPKTTIYRDVYKLSEHSIVVQYIPKDEDEPRLEINDIADALCPTLEFITVKDGDNMTNVMATNIDTNITDNILTFTCNYDFFVKEIIQEETIKSYSNDLNVKESEDENEEKS